MPAAENDSMSANIRLVTMTISWIGSDFADANPNTRKLRRTSTKITQHSKSERSTVAASRLGSGRFWRKSRTYMGAMLAIADDAWHARNHTPRRARPARGLRIKADLR